jgi:hypothetical protein
MKNISHILLGLVLAFTQIGNAMAIEEPKYQVVIKDGDFELRRYEAMIIAEVVVTGSLSEASNRGFRQVADYIFGNNEDPLKKQAEKIEMTAPVTVEPDLSSKIAMTAPVTVETQGGDQQSTWKLSFVMPSKFSLETLPKPKNKNIVIREIKSHDLAVVRFSGFVDEEKMQAQTKRLEAWLKQQSLNAQGTVQLSRYNPPWTLPFFRRNEIWLRVESKR